MVTAITTIATGFLLPVPFLALMLFALSVGKRRWLGYAGALASSIAFVMTLSLWGTSATERLPWFTVGGHALEWSVTIDPLSLLLCAIISGIGTFIFLYSVGYMGVGEDLRRYYAVMALFAASMMAAVTAGNLVQLFFAWELVGVSSYLLIGFWHDRESAVAAARKAFITIIVGDVFLLGGIFALYTRYATFDIQTILGVAQTDTITMLAAAGIIIGAISKSAQFPLHAWLPDAMEGPTPVSAFLHSAAMVKAGLYLIARFLPLIALAGLSPLLLLIAAVTLIISGCMALVENDVKRVLAYSTMNQLAIILLAFGLGALNDGLYHLLNHSVFKALLFMCAGMMIHIAGTQDMTLMRLKSRGLLYASAAIGVFALAGLPPFSGFFSKDAIMEQVLSSGNVGLIIVMCTTVLISSMYIFRWFFIIFKGDGIEAHTHWEMRLPLPILATIATTSGIVALSIAGSWEIVPSAHIGLAAALSTTLSLLGAGIAYGIYRRGWDIKRLAESSFASFIRMRFLLDDLGDLLAHGVERVGRALMRFDDRVIGGSVVGLTRAVAGTGARLRLLVSGSPSAYIMAVVIGFIIILGVTLL